MAEPRVKLPSVKFDIPLNPDAIEQGLGSLFGRQPVGGNTILAPGQTGIEQQPSPQVSPNITEQPAQLVAQQPPPEPPQVLNASANLPEVSPPPELGNQEVAPQAFPISIEGQSKTLAQQLLEQSVTSRSPVNTAAQAQLNELLEQGTTDRQASIKSMQDSLARAEAIGPDRVAAVGKGIANFSDAFFGTNISKNIPQPKSAADRDAQLNVLRRAIGQEQGALTKQQIDALKATLAQGGTNRDEARLLRALGTAERGLRTRGDKFEIDFRRRKEKIFDRVEKGGLFELNTTFKAFDDLIPNGINGYDPELDGSLPGVGGAEALLPMGKLPDGGDGRRMRQLALGLGNQILKMRSGAQINEQEAVRILGELGLDQAPLEGGGFKVIFRGPRSDTDFILGIRNASEAVRKKVTTLKNAFGEDAYNAVAPGFSVELKKKVDRKKGLQESDLDNMTEAQLKAFVEGN